MAPASSRTKAETFREQLARVEQMAEDSGETWDLSDNDTAALKAVLADRQRMAGVINSWPVTDRAFAVGLANLTEALDEFRRRPSTEPLNAYSAYYVNNLIEAIEALVLRDRTA
jgi:hypothetical protein